MKKEDLAMAFEAMFGEVFELTDPIVTKEEKEEKKMYTKDEVEALLNKQKERLCAKPRTISVGSVIAARRTLEGLGFVEATVSDYYKSETGETAHIDGGLTAATITITKL